MDSLTLNRQHIPLAWLTGPPQRLAGLALSPYEQTVLDFCRRWLAGQERFTLPTSGSTGPPKKISLHRNQLRLSAQLTGQALQLAPGDKALVCLSSAYIAGMMMLVRGFELGLALTIVEPSANPLAPFPAGSHFDFSAFVPLQLQTILSKTPEKQPILDRMKGILVGGGPVGAALLAQLQALSAPVYHTYGMTETVSHVALRRLNGPEAGELFRPLPGVTLGLDERGCLTVRAGVTNNETVVTNDLVTLQSDGSFRWLGRIDHVINSGGVKVQIEKVEAALDALFVRYRQGLLASRRFFVGPIDDPRLGQAVAALIEGPPFPANIAAELRAELQQTLSRYEIPRYFFFLDRFLETPSGKIDRPANLQRNFVTL
jgi:O-succinylbenzoic acid--CoA ligase